MTVRRVARTVCVALVAGLLAAGAWAAPREAADDTLTLEEVVRLHVSGIGADELIARIRAAQVDFDLSEAMLTELRLAGLGEPVIQALLARQAELHPPPTPEPIAEPAQAELSLVVRVRAGRSEKQGQPAAALRVADAVPPELSRQLGLDPKDARIDDLAVYAACLTATHVPDHWRVDSPLGRDFEGTPRHQLLAFVAGATRETHAGSAEGSSMLSLVLPERIALEIDPDEPHEIVIGVALRIAGRYYTVSLSSRVALPPAAARREIEAWIVPHGLDPRAIEVLLPDRPASESGPGS